MLAQPARPTQNRLQAEGKSLPKPRATRRSRLGPNVGLVSLAASMMLSWRRLPWFQIWHHRDRDRHRYKPRRAVILREIRRRTRGGLRNLREPVPPVSRL